MLFHVAASASAFVGIMASSGAMAACYGGRVVFQRRKHRSGAVGSWRAFRLSVGKFAADRSLSQVVAPA